MDIKFELNLKEFTNRKELKLNIVYFIAFKELIFNKVIFISAVLANKVFSYLLILKNIIKPILTINPFIYYS